ncbi:type I-E CRISPR-associated protein Cse2/CasB [Streptomyces sp. ICBB 8177]|uniref:type I-E CRISPR-associated protein Cse2/CasB n=1 Tax=Streptomyces sp. ICBB 8177 TaxID=563922 RepID=UPI000D682D2E|nr:type I-E CRISPR-associated protein Cse2/CasB [Streptomyces sp. ICBB 8177]PWI43204.1 type I-E CRISPR-associated protein Cse2/CasB [Streptomyces sp. ICBB 8177]
MTTVGQPPTANHSQQEQNTIRALVSGEITRLQGGYLADRSDCVAALARLRRGAGRDASAVPDLWGLIDLAPLYADERLHQQAAADAIYTSATLWSLHQQSRRSGMHRPGIELGTAVRRLMPPGEIDEPVRKRFVRVGMSPTLAMLSSRLRELVLLLRGQDIALDYALLAEHLYRWQQPGGPDQVRRAWGRAFHAHRAPTTGQDNETATDSKDAS